LGLLNKCRYFKDNPKLSDHIGAISVKKNAAAFKPQHCPNE